jgi:hypothetical protein
MWLLVWAFVGVIFGFAFYPIASIFIAAALTLLIVVGYRLWSKIKRVRHDDDRKRIYKELLRWFLPSEEQRKKRLEQEAENERKRQLQAEEDERRRRQQVEEAERRRKEVEEADARAKWRQYHESKSMDEISEMDGKEFEEFLARLFLFMGFTDISLTPVNDQGGDLLCLSPSGIRIVVQAKRWKGSVGNDAVQELLGAMRHYKCAEGWVVTNSTFTQAAHELAGKDAEGCSAMGDGLFSYAIVGGGHHVAGRAANNQRGSGNAVSCAVEQ